MLVSQILNNKTKSDTITVQADATIAEATDLLSSRKIGAVVVSSGDGVLDGILSERDVVRHLGMDGPAVLKRKVSELMTAKLITCTGDETALAVLEKMSKGRFRHMPVMDGDKMIGLVSIGDVVQARLDELSMEKDALEGMIMGH